MKKVIICACSSRDFIDKRQVAKLAFNLEKSGADVTVVPDLCRLFEQNDERLKQLEGNVIVACQERAVNAMLDWRGIKAENVLNLRKGNAEAVLSQMGIIACVDSCKDLEEMPREEGTDAWFPVIDRNRCVNCGKCHDFCLFGNYVLDCEKKVRVENPSHCKNNCPACARMCPQQAIIFPKYTYSPINGGLEIEEEVTADMKEFYQAKLRERIMARRAGIALRKPKN